ncbi:MAG: hypothetical protein ACRC1K_26500 [Planctomycetia bacterium]
MLAELGSPDDPAVPQAVQGVIFERFEEMCRRRRLRLPDDLRPAVYRLLAAELAVNAYVFDSDPTYVASATVLHGSLNHLPERFPEFAESPGVFRQAFRHSPSDPEGVLARTRDIEAQLAADDRFADFRDTPFVFRVVAIGNRTDPERYLLRIRSVIDRLTADDRFAELRDTPQPAVGCGNFPHLSFPFVSVRIVTIPTHALCDSFSCSSPAFLPRESHFLRGSPHPRPS